MSHFFPRTLMILFFLEHSIENWSRYYIRTAKGQWTTRSSLINNIQAYPVIDKAWKDAEWETIWVMTTHQHGRLQMLTEFRQFCLYMKAPNERISFIFMMYIARRNILTLPSTSLYYFILHSALWKSSHLLYSQLIAVIFHFYKQYHSILNHRYCHSILICVSVQSPAGEKPNLIILYKNLSAHMQVYTGLRHFQFGWCYFLTYLIL